MPVRNPADIHSTFEEAYNRGDAAALALLYEPGAILVINGQNISGRDEIRKALEALLQQGGRMSLKTRFAVQQQDVAMLHGDWTIEPASGAPMRGMSTEVLRKQPDGSWLYALDNPFTPV